jgi:uncharacterized protein YuzE
MRLTYDATTDLAYPSLRPVHSGEPLGPTLLLENGREFPGAVSLSFSQADGRAVGLEFQMASTCLPAELLGGAERTDGRSLRDRFNVRVGRRVAPGLRAPDERLDKGGAMSRTERERAVEPPANRHHGRNPAIGGGDGRSEPRSGRGRHVVRAGRAFRCGMGPGSSATSAG